MSGLLDLLSLGSLVLLFTSIYRKRPTLRVRYWLIGWCLILVHFAGLLLRPATELGQAAQDFLVLSSLVLGGVFFLLSTAIVRYLSGRWLAVLVTLGVPWLATAAAACFLPAGSPLLSLSAIAGEAATFMVAWRISQRRRAVPDPGTLDRRMYCLAELRHPAPSRRHAAGRHVDAGLSASRSDL